MRKNHSFTEEIISFGTAPVMNIASLYIMLS